MVLRAQMDQKCVEEFIIPSYNFIKKMTTKQNNLLLIVLHCHVYHFITKAIPVRCRIALQNKHMPNLAEEPKQSF